MQAGEPSTSDDWPQEQQEWVDALDDVLVNRGENDTKDLLLKLQQHLSRQGLVITEAALNTAYKNTIEVEDQPAYPGEIELETRIANIIRWNAVATQQRLALLTQLVVLCEVLRKHDGQQTL